MARKDEPEDVEEQEEEDDEAQDLEGEEGGVSINISEETITIELPRDGNEGNTLGQLAKMVEGMGQ
jgi:hypothetical protein